MRSRLLAWRPVPRPDDDALGDTQVPPSEDEDPAFAPTMNGPLAADGVDVTSLLVEQGGRYRRRGELGRGGMGRVLLVFDEQFGREIALKELLAQAENDGSGAGVSVGVVARFLREARVTGQLEHPGIVPVHELGRRADGSLYYTMQRIRGRSLTSKLAEAQTMAQRLELLIHFRHVCEAMAYAHSRGVVHRDLKPDNVMVGEFGETLIVDWGLAKVRGEDDPRGADISQRLEIAALGGAASTIDGHAIGTPAYMSPEQARGDLPQIDERSDVWGLGAMLFELLTGRPPHTGEKAVEVLQKVIDDRPPRVRDVEPKAPPELAAIADRALLRDPSSRYPGAEALAAEIRAFQDGARVHAYEYSSLETLRRFVAKNRAASIAAGVIALAVVAGTLVSYRAYESERVLREHAEARRDDAVERRDEAEQALVDARLAFARSLVEHADVALDAGDPAAAAIYAAGALVHDPTNPASPSYVERPVGAEDAHDAAVRAARAFGTYLDAEDARRYVFVRRIDAASAAGALAPDGRTLVFPAGAELAIEPADGGARRALPLRVDRVLGFLDEARAILAAGPQSGIYALASGERLHALPEGTCAAAAFEDRVAVALDDGAIVVLARDGYEELGRFEAPGEGVAWAGPAHLVVGGPGQSAIERWPWPPGPRDARVELPSPARVVVGDAHGARVVLGLADPIVAVLAGEPFAIGATHDAHGEVSGAAWLDAGLFATAEGADRVVVRNAAAGHRLDTLHVPRALGHRVESGGRLALLAALPQRDPARPVRGSIFRYERHRQRRTRSLASSIHEVRVDGRRHRVLAATLRTLEAFPLTREGLGERTTLAELPPEVGHPTRLATARADRIAVVTDRGAVLLVVDGASQIVFPPTGAVDCALGLAFAEGGDVLYAGGADGSVRRWHVSAGRAGAPIGGHEGPVCGLDVAARGAVLVTSSADGTVRFVAPDSGRLEREVERTDAGFTDVAFSPDGARIAVGDDAGWVTLIERASGAQRARFLAHEGAIARLSWSPDGAHLATAGGGPHGALLPRRERADRPPRADRGACAQRRGVGARRVPLPAGRRDPRAPGDHAAPRRARSRAPAPDRAGPRGLAARGARARPRELTNARDFSPLSVGFGAVPRHPERMIATRSEPTTCREHGLRYDAATHDGCVLCRRASSAPPRRRPAPPRALLIAGAGALALAFAVGVVYAVRDGAPADPAAVPASDPLAQYLAQARAELDAMPVEESRQALEGIGEEARAGTLDTRARRARIRTLIAEVEASRERFRALVPPEEARAHHQMGLSGYAQTLALMELMQRMTQRYDRTQQVIAGRDRIRTAEDARRYEGRVRDTMRDVNADLDQNRALLRRAQELMRQLDAEEARLRAR